MNRKRVLYLYPNSRLGGAEQVTNLIIRHHDPTRWEAIACFLSDGPLVGLLRNAGVPCIILAGGRPRLKRPLSLGRAIAQLARTRRTEKVSLIHSVMGYGHLLGSPASRLAGIPEVWFQHGPLTRIDWMASRLKTDLLLVNSRFIEKEQARLRPWASRTVLLHPATECLSIAELKQAEESAAKFRLEHGINPGETAFGIIARVSPMKGHRVFLEAAGRIARENRSCRFLIIGAPFMPDDHAYERELKDQVRAEGLEDRVNWTGAVPYPQYAAIAACDAVINCSVTPEPFGLTLIEGMMLGRAVIAPDQGGPLEIITDGKDGLLFRSGSSSELAARMSRVTSDPSLREKLGSAGREKVLKAFNVTQMVERLESEYDRLLQPGA